MRPPVRLCSLACAICSQNPTPAARTLALQLFYFSATSHGFGDNDDVQTVLGWPQKSVFGSLNASSWRVYFSDVPSALLMADARAGLLAGNFKSITSFAADAAAGNLPEFVFIEPAFIDIPGAPAVRPRAPRALACGAAR